MIDQALFKKKDKILELSRKTKENGANSKITFEKEWFRNVLFYIGQQWIAYDKTTRRWGESKLPTWYPKPVTNKFASSVNTIKSILIQKTPRAIIRPSSSSDEDIATAEIGDSMVDIIETESKMKMAREIASSWLVNTGNVFFHSYYYVSDKLGKIFIPFESCQQCGKVSPPNVIENNNGQCPQCQSTNFGKAIDQNGNEIGASKPKGELRTEAVAPFEMFFNQEVEDFKQVKRLCRSRLMPVDDLKELYPEIKDKIGGSSNVIGTQSQVYQRALFYITNTGGSGNTYLATGSKGKIENETVDYFYSLPDSEFPQGLICTIVGEEIVELTDLESYKDNKGQYFLPFVHCGANRAAGRFWHKTLVDDIVKKQIQRNKLESFIELYIYTMSSGKWLEQSGADMDRPTGEPGQVIKYNRSPDGLKPEHMQGEEVPQTLVNWLIQIDKDFEELAASYDVLKGQLPSGLDTFSGLRLLTERAFSRHNEMIENWERANEEVLKQQIEIARNDFTEERTRTLQNEYGTWETKTFSKADLQGGIDVKVEAGSTIPKSQAAEQAAIIDSIHNGLIDVSNVQTNFKILEKLGQSDLANQVSLDIKDAMREWKSFLDAVNSGNDPQSWSQALRPRFGIDNESIHYADAVSRAKSDEFFKMPQEAQQLWIEHANYHKMNLDQAMAQQQANANPAPPVPASNGKSKLNQLLMAHKKGTTAL